jgi:hypothetical protein
MRVVPRCQVFAGTSALFIPSHTSMTHASLRLNLLLLAAALLSGCAATQEKLDSGWRVVDPAGHRRFHRDRYYPHERKIGIKLPGDAGR